MRKSPSDTFCTAGNPQLFIEGVSALPTLTVDLLSQQVPKRDQMETIPRMSNQEQAYVKRELAARSCAVCHEEASGMYFGALVCLPCKSFFIRSTKYGIPSFTCLVSAACDVSHGNRLRCQYCRFKKCLRVGMCRKEKPEIVQPAEGQVLCRVCHDIANGVHFGVPTCEGCKKFFRRALKESNTYFCKYEKRCTMNPRNRNSCRYCRYQMCINVGMSRNAIKMGRPKKLNIKDLKRSINMVQCERVHSPMPNHLPEHHRNNINNNNTKSPSLANQYAIMESIMDNGNHKQTPSDHLQGHYSTEKGLKALETEQQHSCIRENTQATLRGTVNGSNPQERSVIKSCGNPATLTLPQFGEIVSRGFSYLTDAMTNQQSYKNTGTRSSTSSDLYSGTSSNYSSSSPLSDRCASSFDDSTSSECSGKDPDSNLMDIGDDLKYIISSLNQCNNSSDVVIESVSSVYGAIDSNNVFRNSNNAATATMLNNAANDQDQVSAASKVDNMYNHEHLDTLFKQEPLDFHDSCQYNNRSAEISTIRYSRDVISAYDHIMKTGTNESGRQSSTVAEQQATAALSSISQGEHQGLGEFCSDTPGAGVTPQSNNLFSQMYNSLLLTYNVGNFSEVQTDEAKYTSASFLNNTTAPSQSIYI